ncbi:MAG: hypothetical protein WCK76_06545 [Elusimicrobiota bacterium]
MPGPWHRPALRTLARTAPFFLALCACAPSRLDTIQVGPWFPARPAREVQVFSSREQTRRQWGAIGIIHGPRVPAGSKEIEKHKREALKAAAKMGADGLILVVETGVQDDRLDVRQDPENFVTGLAIKYAANTSTSAR